MLWHMELSIPEPPKNLMKAMEILPRSKAHSYNISSGFPEGSPTPRCLAWGLLSNRGSPCVGERAAGEVMEDPVLPLQCSPHGKATKASSWPDLLGDLSSLTVLDLCIGLASKSLAAAPFLPRFFVYYLSLKSWNLEFYPTLLYISTYNPWLSSFKPVKVKSF